MISGVHDVYYCVSDMQRAVRFYHDVLGLRLVSQSDHWTLFDVGGARLGLHIGRVTRGGGAVVSLRVRHIDTAVEEYREQGVKFQGPVAYEPWGASVAFEDPDGNVLKLVQPPG